MYAGPDQYEGEGVAEVRRQKVSCCVGIRARVCVRRVADMRHKTNAPHYVNTTLVQHDPAHEMFYQKSFFLSLSLSLSILSLILPRLSFRHNACASQQIGSASLSLVSRPHMTAQPTATKTPLTQAIAPASASNNRPR